MRNKENRMLRWGTICATVAGVAFIIPLVYVFILLPAAGSSSSHALNPADFLPWMAEKGQARVAFWWATALPFLIASFGAPMALKQKQREDTPIIAWISARAGNMGLLTCGIASLALAAGEMSIAQAYVAAQAQALVEAQEVIIALSHWQRVVIAILFDFLGFFMLGVWILGSSIAGLRAGSLPKSINWFGIVTALLCFSFAFGYVFHIEWLGEFGIGSLAFLAVPAWLVWLGIVLWKEGNIEET